ncbi:MAG TPA: GatB/YqeY domain-containing protein [Ktedonobacterales bacterium]|nr:GatB/YqeY domain-containing protein [Ktedonobacterales bacterium]
MAEDSTASSAQNVEERIRDDLKEAARARDQVRMDTLRMALTAFRNEEVARSREALSDQDRFNLLKRQIKQREEAAKLYHDANRPELAEKEEREAEILRPYLPADLSDHEIRAVVARLVEEQGKDFRKVMPLASKETRGRADGRRVQEIVRELTS